MSYELNQGAQDEEDYQEHVDGEPTQTGNKRPAKGAGLMDDDELQTNVAAMLTDCREFVDGELSPQRALATDYYLGKCFGNESEGRSQVVMTAVRDSVLAVLPPLLRVFFSSDRVVEFNPTNSTPEAVAQAEQKTDYCNYVFREDNDGFLQSHSVFKDGLVRKVGVFKWGWDDSDAKVAYKLDNVDEEGLEELKADDDVKINRVTVCGYVGPLDAAPQPTAQEVPQTAPTPQGPPPAPAQPPPTQPWQTAKPQPLYCVELTRVEKDGRARVWTLPPEEFLFSREGRTIDDAVCVAHVTNKKRGELIAMGYTEEELSEIVGVGTGGDDTTLRNNLEEIARREVMAGGETQDVQTGPENDEILYTEAYVKIDYDGDGIAELRRVCCVGTGYRVVRNDPTDERPFAIFCPDPEPHTMLGQSWADRTMDLQRIESMLMRGTLDSLAASIFPRTAFVEGQANVQDIQNTEIGASMRMKAPGMITPFVLPFTGKEALGVLEYVQEIKERRTGQQMGAAGLDADSLQSSTKEGVVAAIGATQAQQELLARIIAEQTFKPLMRGIARLLIKHQPRKRVVKLRGHWTDVDPKSWDTSLECSVNVGLGNGLVEKKVAVLREIVSEQKDLLTQFGPANPVVTVAQYRNTMAMIAELEGFKAPEQFFQVVPPNWQPPAPPTPPPSPEMMQAQAQIQMDHEKNQRELAIKEAELQLKRQEDDRNYQLAVRKAADDFTLRRYAIDAQFKADFTNAQMQADASQQDRWLQAQDQAHGQALAMHQQAHDQALAAQDQTFQQGIDQQNADATTATAAQPPAGQGN